MGGGACATAEFEADGPHGVPQAGTGGPCPEIGCGTNSPVIAATEFHELSLRGDAAGAAAAVATTTANAEGFAISAVKGVAQIVIRGKSYDLSVEDGRFVARSCIGLRCTVLTGQALTGGLIDVVREQRHYQLAIASARTMPMFLGGGTTESYTLMWSEQGSPPANLCSNVTWLEEQLAIYGGGLESPFGREELMGMRIWDAVVFEGDRINRAAMTMRPRADDAWFNIGCAGHLLAKLRLTRNTIHGQDPQLARAWEQRQATMKMLGGDYCGSGEVFTVPGQRLVWMGDLMSYVSQPREIEARWNEEGATCLVVPRMKRPTTSEGMKKYGGVDVYGLIASACQAAGHPELLPCEGDIDDLRGADRMSANPTP